MNMHRTAGLLAASLALAVFGACGGDDDDDDGSDGPVPQAAETVLTVAEDPKLGAILTGEDGLTLYVFTQDAGGKSVCNDTCAATWPPLIASTTDAPQVEGAAGQFSMITRDDGRRQVAFNGRPLYRYAADKKAGDATGEGVGGVWFVAKADGSAPPAKTPAASSGGSGSDPYGY